MKSETFRALQESSYSNEKVHEVAAPAQPRVFMPNRLVPGKVMINVAINLILLSMYLLDVLMCIMYSQIIEASSLFFPTTRSNF